MYNYYYYYLNREINIDFNGKMLFMRRSAYMNVFTESLPYFLCFWHLFLGGV